MDQYKIYDIMIDFGISYDGSIVDPPEYNQQKDIIEDIKNKLWYSPDQEYLIQIIEDYCNYKVSFISYDNIKNIPSQA